MYCIENNMEARGNIKNVRDGWEELSEQSEEELELISLYKHNKGRGVLEQQYSLQPDMVTGWMPKLPSCPIPLTYQNILIQAVLLKIQTDPRFQIVYRGQRHINSVQVHKSNPYRWKYRQKYEVKVNAISQAVEKVGKEDTPSPINPHLACLLDPQSSLNFSSDFESGNLDLAVRVKPNEYDCFIRSDTNTKGHTNWYYFKVYNHKQRGLVQFNICNIVKPKNLYNKGMTPYTLSRLEPDDYQAQSEWKQNQCFEVMFVERLCRYGTDRVQNQLQFKYDFKDVNMEVSFAYSIPYSFSNLQDYIAKIQNKPFVKVSTLCESFSGLELPLITISKDQRVSKINAILVARIHPGQPNSSHMLEGFIDELLQLNAHSQRLLSSANFYIIPMINPDGVVAGNYRTSFSGRDLNRCFDQIGKFMYPQINGVVDLIKKLKRQRRKVQFFFDFHSHSSKKDLFAYGPEHLEGTLHYFRSRILAKLLQRQDSMFKYQKCIFHISEHKKATARSFMQSRQKIPMTFTFEISNGIFTISKQQQAFFDKKSLLKAGKVIITGLAQYFVQYHREIQSHPRVKVIKFKDERPSLKSSLNSYHRLRKSVAGLRTQEISFREGAEGGQQLRNFMNQIIQEKNLQQIDHEQGSDSQLSDYNDIGDVELNDLFDVRKQYERRGEQSKESLEMREKTIDKLSLRRTRAKKELVKVSSSNGDLSSKENVSPSSSWVNWNKYLKNRIYYEETHPRAIKKVYENPFESKKAIKQKKFPILF